MEEIYEALKKYISSLSSQDGVCLACNSSKLYVDVNALKFNYFQVKLAVGDEVEVMPMVKANAYGAGAEIISNVFKNSKYLAVADVKEAKTVKEILPNKNIVIIYQPSFEDIFEVVKNQYIAAVSVWNLLRTLIKNP